MRYDRVEEASMTQAEKGDGVGLGRQSASMTMLAHPDAVERTAPAGAGVVALCLPDVAECLGIVTLLPSL